jgi:Tfp pilus assembly protein PilF
MSDQMRQIQKMLEKEPNDTFLLYGLGMEYKKANELDKALESFRRVTQIDPGYCYAYHQRGLVHEARGDIPAARQAYIEGMAAAEKKGDAHAHEEIAAALAMIE